jgi:2-amino-4-hydroxy-6-hydroxymethyldihydropteridine diphosphokinase
MQLTDVYLGLGGNIGNTPSLLHHALQYIQTLPYIYNLRSSRFYLTSPVSQIPQKPYINAVCHFQTQLSARQLLEYLQHIEISLGKTPKPKNAPRPIDLDILLFGLEIHQDNDLEIPHPRWMDRLFVLTPLSDLASTLIVPDPCNQEGRRKIDILQRIQSFPNIHKERVSLLQEKPTLPIFLQKWVSARNLCS